MSTPGTTTVVMAAFNAEAFVAEAIASVQAQTRPVDEIIVVDDGSTDRTAEIVAGLPGVTLIRQENTGPAAARNTAIVLGRQRLLVMDGASLPNWVPAGADPEALDPVLLPRPTNSFLARREVFDTIGGYAEDMQHGEDSDWFLRTVDAGFAHLLIDDVILLRRIHGQNLTHDVEAQRRAMFDVLQRRIARRRTEKPTATTGADEPGSAP